MGLYIVEDDTVLSRYVEHFGTLQLPDSLRDVGMMAPLIPEGGTVIDAGACIGDHTVLYAQLVGPQGTVYAVEPHPVTYQALVKNTAILNNVQTANVALSDAVGESTLTIAPNVGASWLGDRGEWTDFPQVTVPVTTLDALHDGHLHCDFIHLDAEGLEPAILRGAKRLIESCWPTLLVEVTAEWLQRAGSSEQELLHMLRQWGYQLRPLQNNTAQYDVLAFHPNRVERQIIDTLPIVSHTQPIA